MPDFSTACFMAWDPSLVAGTDERDPWKDPIGVLTAEVMTTSLSSAFVDALVCRLFEEASEISLDKCDWESVFIFSLLNIFFVFFLPAKDNNCEKGMFEIKNYNKIYN